MATMREVAARAHVSVATVSRVINKTGYVSPDLEERVFDAMRALHYQPSALARSLRRQETRTIGLLIPQLDLPFFSTLAYSIERILFDEDYRVLICSSEEDPEREKAYSQMLMRQRVDGVILAPTGHSPQSLRNFIESKVPVVLVDRDVPEPAASKVLVNNVNGGYAGMKYLLENGHRRIGLVGAPTHSNAIRQRIEGAYKALNEFRVHKHFERLALNTDRQFNFGYQAAFDMLQGDDRPTAIFALTDVAAVGVMHAAARLNLKIPDHLSVMGFDNIPLSEFIIPELSTVAQPIREMGEIAAHEILNSLDRREPRPETFMLETSLVIRQSILPFAST